MEAANYNFFKKQKSSFIP